MVFSKYKVLRSHGRQYIKDLQGAVLPDIFRGRPELSPEMPSDAAGRIEKICPTRAFAAEPLSIDLGRCTFCGECAGMAPDYVRFTNDYRMGTNKLQNLIVTPDSAKEIFFDPLELRYEICRTFGRSLKLRQVSAGGDNSTEMELNAALNVNFDFVRYGVDFVASPRHADGIVITGPITANISAALDICYASIAEPKILIVAGTDAISGGVFAGSPALDRSFLDRHTPDLWLPGNPVHPLTFIDGVRTMLNYGKREAK